MGDWVAWKPEMAPQATVMHIRGQIGSSLPGYMFSTWSQISSMGLVPL